MFPPDKLIRAELQRTKKITLCPCLPSPAPFLEVQAGGICQTDRKAFQIPPLAMTLPRVLGHEVCGRLSRAVNGVKKGSRVALWPALTCGVCRFCKSGRENLCREIQLFGCHLDGGFADTICLPENLINRLVCLKLPESLSFSQAVFAEPLGCVLHGLKKIGNQPPSSILIIGAGLMGRLAARTTRIIWPGCRISIYDNNPKRLEKCREQGTDKDPGPAETVFIAASARKAFYFGLQRLEPGGTIILFSGFRKDEKEINLNHNLLHQREQRLIGAYGCCPADMKQALELMAGNDVRVNDLISRIIPLKELEVELARKLQTDDYKTIIK